jgi:hypothetical protein
VFQDQASLGEGHARKKVGKIADGNSVFEIFEQCRDRHARPEKDPSAADEVGVTFHGLAGRPINHGGSVALRQVRIHNVSI